jgi:predicted signal transduction protein with EAL and GGDEF domain
MAKSLRHHVVGEGVETEEQMAFLRANGCDGVQGYYLSMPLAAELFAKLLKPGIASFIPRPRLKGTSATSPWLIPTKKHLQLN